MFGSFGHATGTNFAPGTIWAAFTETRRGGEGRAWGERHHRALGASLSPVMWDDRMRSSLAILAGIGLMRCQTDNRLQAANVEKLSTGSAGLALLRRCPVRTYARDHF
jgi:hypothetical protein